MVPLGVVGDVVWLGVVVVVGLVCVVPVLVPDPDVPADPGVPLPVWAAASPSASRNVDVVSNSLLISSPCCRPKGRSVRLFL